MGFSHTSSVTLCLMIKEVKFTMEITKLTAGNIHGLTNISINPEKLNFITGPSGSGKSSIMEAIRYAISGKAGEDHIKTGSAEAVVLADIPRIGIIERRVTNEGKTKVRLNGKATTAKSIAEQFSAVYGFTLTDAGLLMSSDVLEHALGKDLAEYLLNGGFIKNDMPFSRLLALNPLDPEIADELDKSMFSPETISTTTRETRNVTLESIEDTYQQYRGSRPTLKKMYADEAAQSKYEDIMPTKTAAALQTEITELQTKIAVERRKAQEYPKALKEAAALAESLKKAEANLAALSAAKPVTERERKIANDNRMNATKALDEARLAIQAAQQDVKNLRRTLDLLATSKCPISNQLVCTTDKTTVRSEIEDAIQLKPDSIDMLEARLSDYQKNLDEARHTCDDLVRQESEYTMRLTLVKQVESLRNMSIAVPEKPDSTVLAGLETALEQLRTEHNLAVQYERAMEHKRRADALAHRLEIAETMVRELAPNGGVRRMVLSHSIGPMEDVCNESMKLVLPKYKLRFDVDDNFNIKLENAAGQAIAYDSLSNGEQLRVVFVIMLMLNQVNQVRILMLDNLNDLDINAFQDFLKMLESVDPSYYDHIFLSGIDHDGFVGTFNKCSIPHVVISCSAT